MRLDRRDTIATILVTIAALTYLGYVVLGELPLVQDARGMGAVGIILGAAAFATLGLDAFGPRWLAVGGGALTLALGITAAVLETGTAAAWFLAAFFVALIAMLILGLARHLEVPAGRGAGRHAGGHA
ncbi:hypothetical protein [Egicoccus sp. AB-alg2]|uniref:hypothetical protein n=1 Tax=Egicoccus sp. AB-alg2 TaxID=3242693 RepID=UPI00359E67D1